MLYPIIDIGSNTVKLSVLDGEHLFRSAPVFFKAVPLGLRARIADGLLTPDAAGALCALLSEYRGIAERLTPQPPIVFATASLRGLKNQAEVLEKIRCETGLAVEVISGETEAYYSFLGARGKHAPASGAVVDLGGGSTEILTFYGDKVLKSVSLPFGCLTLYSAYFADGKKEYEECRLHIRRELELSAPRGKCRALLLSGGSAKAMLKYKRALTGNKTFSLTLPQMQEILDHFENGEETSRREIERLLKDRFYLIPPALCVFTEIAAFYRLNRVSISKSGVREGCLFHFLKNNQKI